MKTVAAPENDTRYNIVKRGNGDAPIFGPMIMLVFIIIQHFPALMHIQGEPDSPEPHEASLYCIPAARFLPSLGHHAEIETSFHSSTPGVTFR